MYDFTECHKRTGLRSGWQWQLGALSLLLTWLNLLSNVRKLPFLGIYVVMFSDVTVTFLKFSIIVILFLVAFALGFHTLIAEKVCYIGENKVLPSQIHIIRQDFHNFYLLAVL